MDRRRVALIALPLLLVGPALVGGVEVFHASGGAPATAPDAGTASAPVAAGTDASAPGADDAARTPAADLAPALVRLDEPLRGRRALRALGSHVAEAAARSHLTVAQARQALLHDPTMWIDTSGRLFVKEEPRAGSAGSAGAAGAGGAGGVAEAAGAASATPYPLDQTFALHSLPGSGHTIYLNFGPSTVDATSEWTHIFENGDGATAGPVDGWDPSGDGDGTFSTAERAVIQEAWQRIAEDYAAFDVDVTTQQPTSDALRRTGPSDTTYGTELDVTDDPTLWNELCEQQCGGIAMLGTIDQVDPAGELQHAYVFTGGTTDLAKGIAEAGAHEVGHTFGLTHQGLQPDTDLLSYYQGSKLWGPIMGAPYQSAVSQWAKGGYAGANNQQDEIAVIEQSAPARTDEAGDSAATAAPLPTGTAYITGEGDIDTYALGACLPSTIDAEPAAVGADLDLHLSVVDSTGAEIAADDPAASAVATQVGGFDPRYYYIVQVAAGLDAHLSGLSGGTAPYYLVVRGGGGREGGAGDASTDYDAYGSIGAYTLAVSACDGATSTDPSPATSTDPSPATSSDPVPTSIDPSPATSSDPAPTSTGPSPTLASLVTYQAPGAPGLGRAQPGRKGGRTTIRTGWSAPASTGGQPVLGYQVTIYKLTKRKTLVAKRIAVPASTLHVEVRLPRRKGVSYAFAVQARNSVGLGAASVLSRGIRPR